MHAETSNLYDILPIAKSIVCTLTALNHWRLRQSLGKAIGAIADISCIISILRIAIIVTIAAASVIVHLTPCLTRLAGCIVAIVSILTFEIFSAELANRSVCIVVRARAERHILICSLVNQKNGQNIIVVVMMTHLKGLELYEKNSSSSTYTPPFMHVVVGVGS